MNKLHLVGALSVLSIAVGGALPAFAGEGAAAGAASYRLTTIGVGGTLNNNAGSLGGSLVTGSAVAGAVGKNNASAAAFNTDCGCDGGGNLSATAHGSAGRLNTYTTVNNHSTEGGVDNKLNQGQANSLTPANRFSSGVAGDQVKF